MNRIRALVSVSLFFASSLAGFAAASASTDWPGWRGPTRDGQAAAGQTVPLKWSETQNVVWRTGVRGKGHSSPTVVGDRIYLATADEAAGEQLVLAFDRAAGKPAWATVVHKGKLNQAGHRNTSQASSTVTWDGERLYINFINDDAVHTTALDRAGKVLWQQRVSEFVMHQGFGSSPVVHDSIVVVSADHRGGGKVVGLDARSGRVVWRQDRPQIPNYVSPALLQAAGRTQVVLGGCNLVVSLDPLTGRKLWEIAGSTEEMVVTAATDGQRVFVSGGYPKNHVVAVEADGSGKVAWQNGARLYVPSMLVRDGHIFAVLDAGQAVCWKADTGEERWREKVDRDFYASPIMVGTRVYATSQRGVTSVFEATPSQFKLLAQNQLGDEAMATPAICGNRIYLRHAKKGSPREEFLWCIGE
ncbi:MAG: PQQ-binding-like beta-propeller repeat protein [Opitutaceae bacterium]|nr:PQQ-binding-like beta-propeller repeat protein [Opitutaceae bacterium]